MNSFVSVNKLLFHHIQLMDSNKKFFVKNPDKDFTRKRKLPFSDIIHLILSMECGSIHSELLKHSFYSPETATSSAFIQQREKIKPEAFRHLFYSFSAELPSHSYNGYHLYAVDGSDVLIPLGGKNETYQYFGRAGQSPYHQIHLNAVYDLLSKQYIAAEIEPRKGHNERNAFHKMLEQHTFPKSSLFIFDRGYEGYPLMAHISQKEQFFLIRVKDSHSGGILKGISLPKQEEFDFLFDKILVNQIRKEHKQNLEKYHRVHQTYTPYFLNKSVKEYPLAFRIIRIRLDNGSYECLMTNLPETSFDKEAVKKLYRMRWGIETSFRHLKYAIGLLSFHSKKIEAIEQEIWARLILYNYCMAITNGIRKRQTHSRYSYQMNLTNAIFVCRRLLRLRKEERPPDMEKLIFGELLPIRPDRHSPRKSGSKQPRRFNYRTL